jgi:superfamily II DNA helicase RecQ
VVLRVQGGTVALTAGGKSASFQLPADIEAGFYGVLVRGPGFASLQALRVDQGAAR